MPKVKMLRDWHGFDGGKTYDMGGGAAEIYVREGVAEYVLTAPAPQSPSEPAPSFSMRPVKTRDIPGPRDNRRNP